MAEMASVPRLERCPPGPTSPSRALVTVECGETPSGRGPQEAACRCAGWAGMLSAAQLQCYHAGHPGPGPKLVDGLPEMRPRAPRIVSGQKRAGSLPGQGGERGHMKGRASTSPVGPWDVPPSPSTHLPLTPAAQCWGSGSSVWSQTTVSSSPDMKTCGWHLLGLSLPRFPHLSSGSSTSLHTGEGL